nr:unnamed protein product [Naegleria fowleri]
MKKVTCLEPRISQKEVFERTTLSVFHSFFRGLSVLVFSIGATGTGKTYTMIGGKPEDQTMMLFSNKNHHPHDKRHPAMMTPNNVDDLSLDGENRGIIPRAFEEIFTQIAQRKEDNLMVTASFVELYLDNAYDLVNDFSVAESMSYKSGRDSTMSISSFKSSSSSHSQLSKEQAKQSLSIKGGTNENGFFVSGAKEVEICNATEGKALVRHGIQKRRTRGHKLNQESSRSHAILTIKLYEKQEENGTIKKTEISRMMIADLAGNERLNETEMSDASGKQESIKINSELSTFARCIASMAKTGTPISARETNLTKLLLGKTVKETKVVSILTYSPLRPDTSTKDFAKNVFSISKPSADVQSTLNTSLVLSSSSSQPSKDDTELLKLYTEMLEALKDVTMERQTNELNIRQEVLNLVCESVNSLNSSLNEESEIKIKEMKDKLDMTRQHMASYVNRMQQQYETKLRECQKAYRDLAKTTSTIRNNYLDKSEKIALLQTNIRDLEERNERMEQLHKHLEEQHEQLKQQYENESLITERLKSELASQSEQFKLELEQQKQHYEKILATKTQEYESEKKGLLDKHENEIQKYMTRITKLKTKVEEKEAYVKQAVQLMKQFEQAKEEEELQRAKEEEELQRANEAPEKASLSSSFFGKVKSFFSSTSKSEDKMDATPRPDLSVCTNEQEIFDNYTVNELKVYCRENNIETKKQAKKKDFVKSIARTNKARRDIEVVDLTDEEESNQRKRKYDLRDDVMVDESPSKKNKMEDDDEEEVVVKKKTSTRQRKKK